MKTIKHWREKSKKMLEDGKISPACKLIESTLWNGHTTKRNLHVQHNPSKNSNDILHINRKINPEIHMETQKNSNSQNNSEQKKSNTWLQTILQSHNNKNRMVLAEEQTGRPMDQNRRLRHKPMHLQTTDLWQRSTNNTTEETASSTNVAGKTGYPHVEDWN
jgi:hypothetical protein